jgi:hypothetical protein
MDMHKNSIDVVRSGEAGSGVRRNGAIGGDLAVVSRLARKLEATART